MMCTGCLIGLIGLVGILGWLIYAIIIDPGIGLRTEDMCHEVREGCPWCGQHIHSGEHLCKGDRAEEKK